MTQRACCGCVYRFPEKNDPWRPRAVASTVDALREWQVAELVGQLPGLPVHVNHHMAAPTAAPNAVAGSRALGSIARAWLDGAGALHWTATLTFLAADRDLLHMYDCGLLGACSLKHIVINPFTTHTVVPVEVSLCHRGRRPGTSVYTGGDVAAYMRNNGCPAIAATMDPVIVPPSADIMIEAANKVASFQAWDYLVPRAV